MRLRAAPTETCAMPPRIQPKSVSAKAIRRSETRPSENISPARRNIGTATSTNASMP